MSDDKKSDMQRAFDEYLRSSPFIPFIVGREASERSDPKAYERQPSYRWDNNAKDWVAGEPLFPEPLEFDSMRFGPRDIADAKSQAEAAQIILTNMFYETFDDDRVWTNEEWRAAISKAADCHAAFSSILADERTSWRNDDFAERVIAIRDR